MLSDSTGKNPVKRSAEPGSSFRAGIAILDSKAAHSPEASRGNATGGPAHAEILLLPWQHRRFYEFVNRPLYAERGKIIAATRGVSSQNRDSRF
jgi:hypothetical protein